jgi:hypothetical protein
MRAQFGKSIRPELGRLDYSGIARAAEIRAQSMSNLGQMVGQAITGYKKRKDDEKKIDMYATDLFNILESDSPEDVRKLNLFGINQGTFGDFNDEEKLDSIKNTLKTFGIEGITALENSYRTTELKLQQDLERIKADQIDVSKITDKDPNTFDTTDLTKIENSEAFDKLPQEDKEALNALKTGTNTDGTPLTNANKIYDRLTSSLEKAEQELEKEKKITKETEARTEGLGSLFKGTGSFTGKDNPASFY